MKFIIQHFLFILLSFWTSASFLLIAQITPEKKLLSHPKLLFSENIKYKNQAQLTFSIVEVKFDGFALVDVQVRKPHGKSEQHQQQQKFELLSDFLHRESQHFRSCSIISSSSSKKECQPLLSLALQRTSPDVTMSYLQQHQVRFTATKLLVSQSHLHNSSGMKVLAASQFAALKFVASQWHISPDGSRISLVLLKVKTPQVIFTIYQLLLGLAHFTKRCRNVTLQQQKKVSCFSL